MQLTGMMQVQICIFLCLIIYAICLRVVGRYDYLVDGCLKIFLLVFLVNTIPCIVNKHVFPSGLVGHLLLAFLQLGSGVFEM